MIAKIKRLPLRDVWKHEAYDFTTWLQENVDVLNDVLDLNLVAAEREQSAGTFSVDIVAEDESGNPIVIENQLEKSDHDHLGKLITYLAVIPAVKIWYNNSLIFVKIQGEKRRHNEDKKAFISRWLI